MDEAVAYFLDLRIRYRRHPEARAVIDRCLSLLARAASAKADEVPALEREVEELRDRLVARLGPAKALTFH